MTYPYRLLAPGPVQLPPEVLQVLAEPIWHHRIPAFEKVLAECLEGLKEVFKTKEPVLILTSTGSGAMEAAVTNTLSPGDKVFCVVAGKFGERWAEMCKAFGFHTHIFELEWGKALDLNFFESELKKVGPVKAVLSQVCETSSGTLFPVKKMTDIAKRISPGCLFMADAITALGATQLNVDDYGLDVVVAGSQKAFMLPTGLSFITLSKAAWAAHAASKCPRYYFDLGFELKAIKGKQTYYSTSVALVRALAAVLPRMTGKNLEALIDRSHRLMTATHAGASELGFKLLSESPSPSVTALLVPTHLNSEIIRGELESKFNLTIMGGQDKLKGKILRVGHLGYIKNSDMLFLFNSLAHVLRANGETITDSQLSACEAVVTKALGHDID